MTEHEFMLQDRLAKIRSVDEQINLRDNSYLAFSGGKDSVIVSKLLDMALPHNNIPRVYANTGLEFVDMVHYVKELAIADERIVILNQTRNIKETLEKYGYPFKSKEHSMILNRFNMGTSKGKYIDKYTRKIPYGNSNAVAKFLCPKKLMYQFEERGKYNFSDQCCYKLKKEMQTKWQRKNNKKIFISGMRKDEGGNRAKLSCITNNGTHFHPIIVCSSEWENWFINEHDIRLCKLYYPPYNFERTGCVGCPFDLKLEKDLDTLSMYLPRERERAESIFAYTYAEYRRIGYRLKKPYEKEFNFGGEK